MNDFNPLLLVCGIFCVWPLLVGALPTYLLMRYKPRVAFSIQRDDAPDLEGYARPVQQVQQRPTAVQNPNPPRRTP